MLRHGNIKIFICLNLQHIMCELVNSVHIWNHCFFFFCYCVDISILYICTIFFLENNCLVHTFMMWWIKCTSSSCTHPILRYTISRLLKISHNQTLFLFVYNFIHYLQSYSNEPNKVAMPVSSFYMAHYFPIGNTQSPNEILYIWQYFNLAVPTIVTK